jgi:Calcium binding
MPSKPFQPGDRVVWWKQTPGGGYVFPVLSTVLAVTAKRVKIEADDEEGNVIRHVLPTSIEHHAPPPKSGGKPPKKSDTSRSKRSGKQPASGRPKGSGQLVVWSGRASTPEKDEVREERITMEIVVDAYDEDERALGWYYYLQEKLGVPFRARCVEEREVSPLSVGEEVEVVGMPPERECEREMFVSIRWGQRKLAVPLAQLEVIEADDETREAVEDWHYWVGWGYQF